MLLIICLTSLRCDRQRLREVIALTMCCMLPRPVVTNKRRQSLTCHSYMLNGYRHDLVISTFTLAARKLCSKSEPYLTFRLELKARARQTDVQCKLCSGLLLRRGYRGYIALPTESYSKQSIYIGQRSSKSVKHCCCLVNGV